MFFLDPLNGGAWPLLVGGVICLVDSVNGRDPSCPLEAMIVLLRQLPHVLSGTVGQLIRFLSAGFQASRLVKFWATAGL